MATLFSAALLWLQPNNLVNAAPNRLGPVTEIHGWPTPAFVYVRFDNVYYTLNICAECCRSTITHRCDGSTLLQPWNDHTCTHLRRPLWLSLFPWSHAQANHQNHRPNTSYIDVRNRHRLQCRPAHELLHTIREYVRRQGTAGERELFRPLTRRTVRYEHTGCLYSADSRAVIQGVDGIARSIFFRRCNGDYVNAVGEVMEIT